MCQLNFEIKCIPFRRKKSMKIKKDKSTGLEYFEKVSLMYKMLGKDLMREINNYFPSNNQNKLCIL